MLALELAPQESETRWREVLLKLKERGFDGVEFGVSDDPTDLRKALAEVLTEAALQHSDVHFLRNALDDLPRQADDDGREEFSGSTTGGTSRKPSGISETGSPKAPEHTPIHRGDVEHIGETLTCYRLLRAPRPADWDLPPYRILSAPDPGPLVETHESWLKEHRSLDMDLLGEQHREHLRQAAGCNPPSCQDGICTT